MSATDDLRSELARFNAERARLLGDRPRVPGERLPLPFTRVGGDLPPNPDTEKVDHG